MKIINVAAKSVGKSQIGEISQILIIPGLKGERIKNEDRVLIEEKASHVLYGSGL